MWSTCRSRGRSTCAAIASWWWPADRPEGHGALLKPRDRQSDNPVAVRRPRTALLPAAPAPVRHPPCPREAPMHVDRLIPQLDALVAGGASFESVLEAAVRGV